MKNSSSILISLDGLSVTEFQSLFDFLPKSREHLKSGFVRKLDTGNQTSAQAIWGEILTGEPWFKNGCFGYAKPLKSLNSTRVTTENDFVVPIKLFDERKPHLICNVPLLLPKEPQRAWLSDGSLPVPITVSPRSLTSTVPLSEYKPRRWNSVTQMFTLPRSSVLETLTKDEEHRLACIDALMKEGNFSTFLVRIAIFDQLAHLLGTGCLASRELSSASVIQQYLARLDEWICAVFRRFTRVHFISAFCHAPCKAKLSLNQLLYKGGFLRYQNAESSIKRRVASVLVRAAADEEFEHLDLNDNLLSYGRTKCQSSAFDTGRTLAASPVHGCVWINTKGTFDDGIVEPGDVERICEQIRLYLVQQLRERFGDGAEITQPRQRTNENAARVAPDLFIHMPNVELHNSRDPALGAADLPRTTHEPGGFYWSRHDHGQQAIAPTGICGA